MTRGLVFCLSVLIMIQSQSVAEKPKPVQLGSNNRRVERAESRPDLAMRFADVARLKIASRKSTYNFGEMITLDIALLNTSSQPLFFRKPSELRITALNAVDQRVAVQLYGVSDRAVVPASFVRLAPGEIIVHSFQLLAGCDRRAFAQVALTKDDDLTVFESGLFLNWGDACLQTTRPETYNLFVEVKNDFVLLTSRIGKIRTAVGTLKSNSLEMKVGY